MTRKRRGRRAIVAAGRHTDEAMYALIDAIPHLVWIARPDGSITYNNQRLIEYLAMTREQAEGNGWFEAVHPDDQPRVQQAWQTSIQMEVPYEVEHRMRDGTSGVYRWFLVRGMPQRDAQGTILYWVGTCTDIEERKQAEQQLKASEQNWRILAEVEPQLVWIERADGSVEYVNQRYIDYLQAGPDQLQDGGWSRFLHADDVPRTQAAWRHACESGEPYEIEYRLKQGQTGVYRWFLARAMPVRDDAGQVVKWFGTCTDIEEQKHTEQQLKVSREEWRVLAETVPQLVWTMRADGWSDYWNQRFCEYTNATPEQLQGYGWSQFLHPEDYERTLATRKHAFRTGTPYEVEYRFREGQTGRYRWFLARAMPVRDEAGQIVKWFGTCTDIDEQKRVEEALRQSQERARVLMNASMIGIFVEERSQILDANDTFLRMTGYGREDLRARRMNVMHMTAPEDRARTRQAQRELATRQVITPFEKEYLCQDGSRLPVLVCGVLLQRHPRQGIAFVLDNSARKELEQRKDTFISMASHELRNPLTALKLQTTMLRRQLTRQGTLDQAPALATMESQIQKIIRLVEELLDVSKMRAGTLEYKQERVDLVALLQEVTETLQQSHPRHTLVLRGMVRASVMGDRDRLGQVFANLIGNAIKYSPDAPTITIDLSTSEEAVTIQVRDQGLGIPRELRDKIFERFYRVTDPKQKAIPGLGMGLYIVAEILRHHGGRITVDSEVGKGSTFTVTLPRTRDA